MSPFYMCRNWHSSGWWKRNRDNVKIRHGWKCCICGVVSRSVEVDHVIPYDNNQFTEDKKREMFTAVRNMWVLCPRCHRKKTKVFDNLLRGEDLCIGAVPYYKHIIKKELSE